LVRRLGPWLVTCTWSINNGRFPLSKWLKTEAEFALGWGEEQTPCTASLIPPSHDGHLACQHTWRPNKATVTGRYSAGSDTQILSPTNPLPPAQGCVGQWDAPSHFTPCISPVWSVWMEPQVGLPGWASWGLHLCHCYWDHTHLFRGQVPVLPGGLC
jgi:hypothetical protein